MKTKTRKLAKVPEIGDKVSYVGSSIVGPCVGTIHAIYPELEWNEATQREGRTLPWQQWHVGMKPDVLPERWSYTNADTFAPEISELRVIEGGAA